MTVHGTQDPDTNLELAHTLGRNQGQENAVLTEYNSIKDHDRRVIFAANNWDELVRENPPCVTGDITHTLKGDGFDASEDGTGRGQPIVPVAFSSKDYGGDATENMSPTLRACGHADSHANAGAPPAVAYPILEVGKHPDMSVRRLTPVECERLQGFPDGHTDVPYRGKPASDGPRYKALGNSKAIPVVAWLGKRIKKQIEYSEFDSL